MTEAVEKELVTQLTAGLKEHATPLELDLDSIDDHMISYIAHKLCLSEHDDIDGVTSTAEYVQLMLNNYGVVDDLDADFTPVAAPLWTLIARARGQEEDKKTPDDRPARLPVVVSPASQLVPTPEQKKPIAGGTSTAPIYDEEREEAKRRKQKMAQRDRKRRDKREQKAAGTAGVEEQREARLAAIKAEEENEFADHSIVLSRGRVPTGQSMDVKMSAVSITVRGRPLLADATFQFLEGHRYGIIGRNGVGKSTLLRRLYHRQVLSFPAHIQVGFVKQEVEPSEQSALELVLAADVERTALMEEERNLAAAADKGKEKEDGATIASRLAEITTRLTEIDAFSAERRAKEILQEMGFSANTMSSPTRLLSGGWRMKVALACALFMEPDLLCVDEPTNHLDLWAVLWLQQYLRTYQGTLLVVSHDREFLNAVCTDIIHFHQQQLKYYVGNYDAYEKTREEKLQHMASAQATLDKQKKHMRQSIEKLEKQTHQKGKKQTERTQKALGTVASRRKKLQRHGLDSTEDGKKWKWSTMGHRVGSELSVHLGGSTNLIEAADPAVKFKFHTPSSTGSYGSVLQLNEVGFCYPLEDHDETAVDVVQEQKVAHPAAGAESNFVFMRNVSLDITLKSRVGLLGDNGSGKSTLMKLITGAVVPQVGTVHRHQLLRVGYFSQHHVQQLDMAMTPVEHIKHRFPDMSELQARTLLGAYGIAGATAVQPLATLSGGEKSRVALATIMKDGPHLIALDEPANHLDIDSIDALAEALETFEGAVVLISHNQSILRRVCTEFYEVRNCPGSVAKARRVLSGVEEASTGTGGGPAKAEAEAEAATTAAPIARELVVVPWKGIGTEGLNNYIKSITRQT